MTNAYRRGAGSWARAVTMALALAACSEERESAAEAADYEAAFPQDEVATIHLTIAPDRWREMLDDMTATAGTFGGGAGGIGGPIGGELPGGPPLGGELPPEVAAACDGLAESAPCEVALGGLAIRGVCRSAGTGLVCAPDMSNGGGLTEANPIYVECTVEANGRRWEHVGVRFKGNSSLLSSWSAGRYKLPFRLDFDRFAESYPETRRQRFYGFEHLSLSNGWSDESLVRDKLGTDVFGEFGVPVPATAFYRVYVDHGDGPTYFGLYTAVEVPSDDPFLARAFGGDEGNLYKPEGTGARWAVYDAASLGKENHVDEADYADAEALHRALHADRSDGAAWRVGLERELNIERFLRWLALNSVIEDWDSYGVMAHNYFIYGDPSDGGRFQWIPWDHTFAFTSGRALPLDMSSVSDDWPLIRFLLDDPVYSARYRELVAEAAVLYAPERARERFERARALIEPFVVGAEGERAPHTHLEAPDAFASAHRELLDHPTRRAAAVAAFLGN